MNLRRCCVVLILASCALASSVCGQDSTAPTGESDVLRSLRRILAPVSQLLPTQSRKPLPDSEANRIAQGVARGVVTDQLSGEPVVGITIIAGHDRFAGKDAHPETKTNVKGEYELTGIPIGETTLHAFSIRHAPAMQSVPVGTGQPVDVDFILTEGKSVTGRIVDPTGNPVPGVRLVTDNWNGARMFDRETRTASDGTFTLRHMPEPAAEVDVLKSGFISIRDLVAVAGKHYELTMLPVIEHGLRIRLADSDQPIRDLEIQHGYQWPGRKEIYWDRRSADTRGYDVAAGVFTISNDEQRGDTKQFWRFRHPGYEDVIFQEPPPDAVSQQIDLVLPKATTVRGTVVSAETGQPLAGVGVALVTEADRLRSSYIDFRHPWQSFTKDFTGHQAITDVAGQFELPKRQIVDDAMLVVVSSAGSFHQFPKAQRWIAGDALTLPLAEAGVIQGRVTVAGQPLAAEIIKIDWLGDGWPSDTDLWSRPFGVGGQVTCDSDGYFRFPKVGAGQYQIARMKSFDRPGVGGIGMSLADETVILLPGQTLEHNIELSTGKTLTGKTVGSQGQPLGETIVEVFVAGDRNERIDAVRADIDGKFTIAHLPNDTCVLEASHYCIQTASTCGLGDCDFRGSTRVDMSAETDVTIALTSASDALLSSAAKLTGSLPPDFTAKIFGSDETFTLSDHWGKVVAIDFWATWCGPCLAVMPEMKAIHEQYRDRDDVVFITISLDEDEDALRSMIAAQEITFPVLFSGEGFEDAVSRAFGVRGIPSSFVVGRDGRFAAEIVHGSKLADTIEQALQQPVDPLYKTADKPARLAINLNLEGTAFGVPGAKLFLSVVDSDEQTLYQDEINVPGLAPRMLWQYPPANEAKIIARVVADGFSSQQQVLHSPSRSETISFSFTAPRTLMGMIHTTDGTQAANLDVVFRGPAGYSKTVTSDEQGRFNTTVVPGAYHYTIKGNDRFAVPPSSESSQFIVPADQDPQPLMLEVCQAVRVSGVVLDATGKPAVNAQVFTAQNKDGVTSDSDGRFQLDGVSSIGVTTLYARLDDVSGSIKLGANQLNQPVFITLGTMADSKDGKVLRTEMAFPNVNLIDLDGKAVDWTPQSESAQMILLCELAHPESVHAINDAIKLASQQQRPLEIFSLDWGLGIARKLQTALPAEVSIHWLGPAGLKLLEQNVTIARQAQMVVISADGKIIELGD